MPHIHTDQKRSKLELLFLVFPTIYLIDLILGFNVHILTIPGVSGANILLALISMYSYALYAILRLGNVNIWAFIQDYFGVFDLVVFVFIFLNLIWAALVPQITGSSLASGLSEGKVFLALMLYFPCVILSRMGYINWERVLNLVLALVAILAVLHIILYVGEKISESAGYDGFEERYKGMGGFAAVFFHYFSKIRIGSADAIPLIIMGNGYIRVIYSTSVLLLMGLYLILKKIEQLKAWHIALFAVFTTAVCATLTKTLWLGIGVGVAAYLICIIGFLRPHWKKILILVLVSIITITATNIFLFDGMIAGRLSNTFSTEPVEENEDFPTEASGTAEANRIRIEQTMKLLEQWRKSPIIGHGYGYYPEDYVRSEEQPYSYEMLIPAMLMKLGVLGILVWAAFIIFIFVCIFRERNRQPAKTGALIFVVLSFIVSVQNNPMLMNFNGMTLMVFILSDVALDQFTVNYIKRDVHSYAEGYSQEQLSNTP